MKSLFRAAAELEAFLLEHGWRYCFIGGIALQRWGQPRLTNDIDLTILTGFGNEMVYVDALLKRYAALSFGSVHVFFPVATEDECTLALLLDIDPIDMVRGRRRQDSGLPLDQYINNRPYVASSFLSVAIAQVLGSALKGECREVPGLAETAMPLEIIPGTPTYRRCR